MKGNTLLFIGLGVAAVYFFGLGQAGNDLQIIFQGVQFHNVNNIQLQFVVQNVSNTAININSMTGVVTVNDNTLGNISTFTPVSVPANSQAPVNVTLQVSLISLPGALVDLFTNSGGELDFNATGNVNIGGLIHNIIVPFNLDKTITV